MPPEERKKLKKVSPNLEFPILLNNQKGLQAVAEFIMTGRKHDTAKIEVRQINQSSSRQLEATQATSQQADSSESGSDGVAKAEMMSGSKETNKCKST
ncbi:hypothetical protein TRICI_001687 [Trichomonascus ciferrii]|uniref:Uncharacterized protein n=1 Tax=Trichomonascus ciferrii TaxID=44093 RepID=A0A642VA92_9ASCO|nr:hypothetical protein TRICI_001687 [Trichomonascus ciferrii]